MLTLNTQRQMQEISAKHWKRAVHEEPLRSIAAGKEIGHKIADMVDEQTTALLARHFTTAYQRKRDGAPAPRSMGDIWVQDEGVFNPVNVKSGEMGKNGQPNMVAFGRVFPALAKAKIDSYYLLIVKMDLRSRRRDAHVYLVDLLDYLDFTHLNMGPGQIMLKESRFYDAVADGYEPPEMSLTQKAEKLYSMLIEANKNLIEARENRQRKFRDALDEYKRRSDDDPIDQDDLNLA